jgi:hypothetical protein
MIDRRGKPTTAPRLRRVPSTIAAAALALTSLGAAGCGSSGGSTTSAGTTQGTAPAATSTTTSATVPSTVTASNLAPIHGTYSPQIDPANFVAAVDNPYLPYGPGMSWRYTGVAEDGTTPQVDDVVVTEKTKRILGVECTVVLDTVSSRGEPVERTYDWYAQDTQGNVWYFGEDARDYKHGHFVKAPDSWEAGVDGAQPGIAIPGDPQPGDAYRQEHYRGHAEDQALVLKSTPALKVPYRSFGKTLTTIERTATEPGVREKKYYAPGVGEIGEAVIKGGHERIELASFRR